MSSFGEHARELLRALVTGRRVILAGAPLAGSTLRVEQLRSLGADRCFVVANGIGTGDLPDPADAEWLVVDVEGGEGMQEFREVERLLADPPPEVIAALDRFDPRWTALVLIAPFMVSPAVAGRPVYGGRRPEWVALEDKTVCDDVFDTAGVERPASTVVAARRDELTAAARVHDHGDGTVWAGDASRGFNGGGTLVRWIRPEVGAEEVDQAVAGFAASCDRVRVAPFLEGLPLGIHGVVCDDGVAALRPVEQVNLRPASGQRFRYAGCATFFDPPPVDRRAMRAAAVRVGGLLAERYRYRGAFTIDGILTADGWLPNELNPRYGAGLGYASFSCPHAPLDLVHHLLVAGDGPTITAGALERALVPAADRSRWGGGWTTLTRRFSSTERVTVMFEGGGTACRRAADGEEPDGEVLTGPGAEGGFVRVVPRADRTPVGPSIAPRILAAFEFADAELGAGIGPLTAPVDVR